MNGKSRRSAMSTASPPARKRPAALVRPRERSRAAAIQFLRPPNQRTDFADGSGLVSGDLRDFLGDERRRRLAVDAGAADGPQVLCRGRHRCAAPPPARSGGGSGRQRLKILART